jgi:hypothetical protein
VAQQGSGLGGGPVYAANTVTLTHIRTQTHAYVLTRARTHAHTHTHAAAGANAQPLTGSLAHARADERLHCACNTAPRLAF